MTWSLCMIVRDEEDVIESCLSSCYKLFDEIIVIDTGSVDSTKSIVSKFTDKIYDFEWCDDFAKARNYSFSKATSDYIMWLDADDIIDKESYLELKKLKNKMKKDKDIYMMPYNVAFDELGKSTFSYHRERLLKNDSNHLWNDRIHEYISLKGKLEYLDFGVNHKSKKTGKSDRNLKIYESMKENNEKFSARNRYYYARELYDNGMFQEAKVEFEAFLNSEEGWIEDNIAACQLLYNICNKLDQDGNKYLLKSFEYDLPRSKTCCLLGDYYQDKKDYRKAIYWYTMALISAKNQVNGFREKDYEEFIPALSMCVCHDRLGEHETAKLYHGICEKLKPNNSSVIYNKEYFKDK